MRILSIGVYHDSSLCSLKNGRIEFFCKEERLSRIKRDVGVHNCISLYRDLNFGKIDQIVYCSPSQGKDDREHASESFYLRHIKSLFDAPSTNFVSFPHHTCHAMLAFTNSGFETALVLVVDRNGSLFIHADSTLARESESIYLFDKTHGHREIYKSFWKTTNANKNEVRSIIQKRFPSTEIKIENAFSIVKVYEAATVLIGQHPLENGKTMGLASYGEEIEYSPLFIDNSPIDNLFDHIKIPKTENIVCFNGMEQMSIKEVTKNNYQFFANKAKHVQIETQKEVLELIKRYVQKTGIKNVCVVGGYALNVVANNYYVKNLSDVNFYFEPTADDTGVSIGGAMLAHHSLTREWNTPAKDNFYHYYDFNEPLYGGKESSIEEVCDLLLNQKSVAVFEGAPEAGPRALGHRSILFDARNPDAKEIVNGIKQREWYRPFAGVILESDFEDYFETLNLKSSSYMTINFECKEHTKQFVPGIIHADNTCRVQTVTDGFLFDLLVLFKNNTGCPMLLNTSLNLAGEPLVQTKAEALEVFKNSFLDAVYFVDENKIYLKD